MNPSSIRSARSEDLPEMCRLLAGGSRSFANVGAEDLSGLLQGSSGAAVQVDARKISGFVVLQQEDFADELSTDAPARVSLLATATKFPGAKAREQFSALFECAERTLPARPAGQLFYALTDQNWLQASLSEAGFAHSRLRFASTKEEDRSRSRNTGRPVCSQRIVPTLRTLRAWMQPHSNRSGAWALPNWPTCTKNVALRSQSGMAKGWDTLR